MKSTKRYVRVLSFVLAVVMLISVFAVSAFAADGYSFKYYFTDDSMTEIYVTGFDGVVPEDGKVEIPDKIKDYTVVGIAEHTFDNLDTLKTVVIPATVTDIHKDAFYGCSNIVDVVVKNKNEIDVGEDVFDATEWYESHKKDYVISGTTLVSYKGSDETVAVPENCTAISDAAFKGNKNIKKVYIGNNVKSIGKNAFADCENLAEIVAGDKLGTVSVAAGAFDGTAWLAEYPGPFVVLGTTLVKYNGSSTTVSVPNMITSIGAYAFKSAEDGSNAAFKVKVPVSVKEFGEKCFYLYKSAGDVYPDIVVYPGSAAENYCKKQELNYSNAYIAGDADGDGKVTARDARYVLRIAAKLESPKLSAEVTDAADITRDGVVNAVDARIILRIAAGLEAYSDSDLLTMPRTDYETLMTASKLIASAKDFGCAYSKLAYQSITSDNFNSTGVNFNKFKNELTSEKKAQTVTYNQGTPEAIANLFDITLVDSDMIQSYSCVISEGAYKIKIVLKDEKVTAEDADKLSKTEQMFPVESVSHYAKAAEKWKNVSFDMTYTGCTIELTADVETLMLKDVTLTMKYNFNVWGKIGAIKVQNSKNNGPATATRQDVVKYTNFVYFEK